MRPTTNTNTKAIILAGGMGTRLSHLVQDVPKPMAKVCGRPFLERVISSLKNQGLKDVVLCVGHKGQYIKNHFKKGGGFGVKIEYTIEKKLLGTGGAIRLASKKCELGTNFFVLNGDCFFDIDYNALMKAHLSSGGIGTIALANYRNPERFGIILLASNGQIVKFEEKKKINGNALINAGVYVFSKKIFDYFPKKHNISLESDIFPKLVKQQLYGYASDAYFIDIGIEIDFLKAQDDFRKSKFV